MLNHVKSCFNTANRLLYPFQAHGNSESTQHQVDTIGAQGDVTLHHRQQPHLARGPKVKAACGGRCSAAVLRHKPRHLIYDISCQRRLGSTWSYQHLTSPLLQTKIQPGNQLQLFHGWPSLNLWILISSILPRSDHHLDHQDHMKTPLTNSDITKSYVLYVTPPGPPVLLGI